MRSLLHHVWKTAEEALQRIQALEGGQPIPPPPAATQIVYVNHGGSDATGNGTIDAPYRTPSHALSTITDASSGKPYTIQMGPGFYTDAIALKSGVSFSAQDPNSSVTFTGVLSFDPGFANNSSFGLNGITTVSQTLNWGTIANGIADLTGVVVDGNLTILGGAGGGSSLFAVSCSTTAALSLTDVGSAETQDFVVGGNISCTAATVACEWFSNGDSFQGSVTNTATAGFISLMSLVSTQVRGALTLDGANAQYAATAGGVPHAVTLLAGAPTPTLFSGANGLQYTATTVANWSGTNPTSIQNALDRIAAKITPIP